MIKPLNDRVLLQKIEVKNETESGIILPDSDASEPDMAKVIAVGDGKVDNEGHVTEMNVSVGDLVIYKKYASTDVEYKDEEYLIVDMDDILAIVEEEE